MMFLDIEEVIKRVSIVLGCVVIIAGFGATYYFGHDILSKLHEGKSSTTELKDKTDFLNKETDNLKVNLLSNTKDLKSFINIATEETKKVDNEVKLYSSSFKQFQQEIDRYRTETKSELMKLKEANIALADQLKSKEQYFNEQIRIRDSTIEKNKLDTKSELTLLNDHIKIKDKEINDLKSKLEKEIDWRNRNSFTR